MPAAQLQPDFVNGVSAAKKSLRFTAEFPKPYVAQHIFNFLQNIKLFHVSSFIYGFSFDLNCLFGVVHMFFRCIFIWVWVNTYRYIFSGMNIHLPAILGFTRYQGFDPSHMFDAFPYVFLTFFRSVETVRNIIAGCRGPHWHWSVDHWHVQYGGGGAISSSRNHQKSMENDGKWWKIHEK